MLTEPIRPTDNRDHPRSQRDPVHERTKRLRFALATAGGVAANLSLYAALMEVGLSEPAANLTAAVSVSATRFLVNKLWVWEDRTTKRTGRQLMVHIVLTVAGLVVSTLVASYLGQRDASILVLLTANVASFSVFTLLKFLANDRVMSSEGDGASDQSGQDDSPEVHDSREPLWSKVLLIPSRLRAPQPTSRTGTQMP